MLELGFAPGLIAPCGMNCGICISYFGYTMGGKRRKMACRGCQVRKSRCAFLQKHCSRLARKEVGYCYECPDFPCERLRRLDRVYRKRFGMSMIENLRHIQGQGIDKFLENERERWRCPSCGSIVCVHNRVCYACNVGAKK
jgi:hypothetical protein